VSDLVEWLTAQLDADETIARASTLPVVQWYTTEDLTERLRWLPRFDAEFIATQSPAHVLRTIAAHRAILGRHGPGVSHPDECGRCNDPWPCADVRHLAAIYQDRSGFDPSWIPEDPEALAYPLPDVQPCPNAADHAWWGYNAYRPYPERKVYFESCMNDGCEAVRETEGWQGAKQR